VRDLEAFRTKQRRTSQRWSGTFMDNPMVFAAHALVSGKEAALLSLPDLQNTNYATVTSDGTPYYVTDLFGLDIHPIR
jgi:hypothetical protein